ncbi:uncharacterized protein LOC144145839 isoform X8 [Haemaphysalis longicornis]
MERVVCRWRNCGVILFPAEGRKFVVCGNCRHVTCRSCDACHEGTNCETFRTQSMMLLTDTPVRASGDVRACADAQASLPPLRSQQTPSPRTSLAGASPGITSAQASPRKEARSPVTPNPPVKQSPSSRASLGGASPGITPAQESPRKEARSPVTPNPPVKQSPYPRASLAGASPGITPAQASPRKQARSPVAPNPPVKSPSPRASLGGASPGMAAPPTSVGGETRSPVSPVKTASPSASLAAGSPARTATETSPKKEARSPVTPAKPNSPVKPPAVQLSPGAAFRQPTWKRMTVRRPQKTALCAKDGCGFWVSVDVDETELPCYKCRNTTCLLCKAIHRDLTCEDYQKQAKTPIDVEYSRPSTVQPPSGAAFSQSAGKQAESPRLQKTVQCASEDCGYEVSVDVDETELPCYKCRNTTCLLCKAVHRDLTCEDYQKQLNPPIQEEEIQVHCAGARCRFIAFVGVSALQLSCPLCQRITCLQCRAVHEFETCAVYQANRRRSSAGEEHSRPVTASMLAAETEQMLHISESSTGSRSSGRFGSTRPEEVLQSFVASSLAPARRDAPKQDAILVQRAASEAQPANEAVMLECCHCLVESSYEEIIEVSSCGHFLCPECVHDAAVNSLTYLVLCPVVPVGSPRCESHIQESALRKVMSPAEQERRKELLSLPILRCPVEGCGGKFCARPGVETIDCPSCNNEYCVPCAASHPGSSCEQFIRVVAGTDAAVRRLLPDDSDDSVDDGEDVVGAKAPMGAEYTRPSTVQPPSWATFSQSAWKQVTSPRLQKTVQCASEDCGYEVSVDVNETELPCYKCRSITCLLCKAVHGDLACEEYQKQLNPPNQKEKIQVHCASARCPFIAFVGVSASQLSCPLCEHITCIQCRAVHEFETCDVSQANRRRSSAGEEHSRPVTASMLAAVTEQRLHISESSTGSWSSTHPEEVLPSFVASSLAPARRDAPKQDAILVQRADSEPSTVQPPSWATFSQSAWKQVTSPRLQKTVQCASEDCGYEVSVDVDETELPCYKCRRITCLLCKAVHGDLACEEYQKQLNPPNQKEKIQVHCASARCPFIAFVGVSASQLSCPLCEHITCIQCRAVHEFETCDVYQANRRRSSAGEEHSRPVTASMLAAVTEQRLHISESSTGSWLSTRPEEVLPSFVASSLAPARRDAPKQDAILVQRADSEPSTVQPPSWATFSQSAWKQVTSPRLQKTVQCASEDCGYEVSVDVDETELPCYKCRRITCLLCKAVHGDLACEEYQKQLNPPIQEEEIQVHCAGAHCPFIAFVGVSASQLSCPLCEHITCIQCRAVHEFETCDVYQANRRRSSAGEEHSRPVTASMLAAETEQRLHISESSTASRPSTRPEEVLPPFVASSQTPARRDAPKDDAIRVQRAASEGGSAPTDSD